MRFFRFFVFFTLFFGLELCLLQFLHYPVFPFVTLLLYAAVMCDALVWYQLACGVAGMMMVSLLQGSSCLSGLAIFIGLLGVRCMFQSAVAHNKIVQSLISTCAVLVWMGWEGIYPMTWWRVLLTILLMPFMIHSNE